LELLEWILRLPLMGGLIGVPARIRVHYQAKDPAAGPSFSIDVLHKKYLMQCQEAHYYWWTIFIIL